MRAYVRTDTIDRIMGSLIYDHGCWLYLGTLDKDGYGSASVRLSNGTMQPRRVHRVVYEALVGPIPDGHQIDHLCRNKACCNPLHLEPVSPGENARRSTSPFAENAKKTHCPKGHPYSGENLSVRVRRGVARRSCKSCAREKAYARLVPKTPNRKGRRLNEGVERHEADQIRWLVSLKYKRREIATFYGISVSSIADIVNFRSWKVAND